MEYQKVLNGRGHIYLNGNNAWMEFYIFTKVGILMYGLNLRTELKILWPVGGAKTGQNMKLALKVEPLVQYTW